MEQRIGPYSILERIGSGGMAEVFLARHQGREGLERLVALKRVVSNYATHPEIRTMFIDEARLLARLVHPYIVQIHDLHVDDKDLWLVTEYIKGSDLRALLNHRRRGVPVDVALRIGLDVAEALDYAHDLRDEVGRHLNVVHRDLKPSNVMVRQDGVVKLLDFGVAKAASKVHHTQVGALKGSLGYFAPELINNPTKVDRRADIFGFGVVLYELLTGIHPFGPLDGPSVVMRMLAGEVVPARKRRQEIPEAVNTLLTECLAIDPGDRPQRMREVAERVAEAMSRPMTFARLAAFIRETVPAGTMRVAMPQLETGAGEDSIVDDSALGSEFADDGDDTRRVGPPVPSDRPSMTDRQPIVDIPRDETEEVPVGRAMDFDLSVDLDGADGSDPTTRMAAPEVARPRNPIPVLAGGATGDPAPPNRPSAAVRHLRFNNAPPRPSVSTVEQPMADIEEEPTFVVSKQPTHDRLTAPTETAHTRAGLIEEDEMPTAAMSETEMPTMLNSPLAERTARLPIRVGSSPPPTGLVMLALWGVLAGLVVVLVVVLLTD